MSVWRFGSSAGFSDSQSGIEFIILRQPLCLSCYFSTPTNCLLDWVVNLVCLLFLLRHRTSWRWKVVRPWPFNSIRLIVVCKTSLVVSEANYHATDSYREDKKYSQNVGVMAPTANESLFLYWLWSDSKIKFLKEKKGNNYMRSYVLWSKSMWSQHK